METYQKSQRLLQLEEIEKEAKKQHEEIRELLEMADNKFKEAGIISIAKTKNITDIIEEVDEQEYIHDDNEMQNKQKTVIVCVDCEKNNEEDIENGGPEYLGYDFLVSEEKVEEMRHYIAVLIKNHNQPLIRTYVKYEEKLQSERAWTLDEIETCIVNGYK